MICIDTMLDAYIECALWSSVDPETEEPLDDICDDVSEETRAAMRKDCEGFLYLAEEAGLITEDDDAARLGHDLWLTQNRHGAGFWDGDWDERGDALTDIAHSFGSVDLWVNESGEATI